MCSHEFPQIDHEFSLMSIETLFFELLQIVIGNRRELSHFPSAKEWKELFELSKKQALSAIAFMGVTKLNSTSDFGTTLGMNKVTYLKWLGLTAKCAQRNKELNEVCGELTKALAHDGLYSCILKGQSNLVNYPEELKDCRTPGDIDIWCWLQDPEGMDIAVGDSKGAHYEKYFGNEAIIEYVKQQLRLDGKNDDVEVLYHHIDWSFKGIECEVHYRPSWMNCPWHNRRLQKWCRDNEQWQPLSFSPLKGEGVFNVPTVEFNAVYQLVHIYRHLFNEGIGLRQLLDYYFVLKTLSSSHKGICLDTLEAFGMKHFASAVMYVLQKVFAMPSQYLLCAPDAKRGEFLLNEIMLAGNFGKYDERNVIGANEGYLKRFVRRQKRFLRFLTQYPSEVIWGPYFTVRQRLWRIMNGYK